MLMLLAGAWSAWDLAVRIWMFVTTSGAVSWARAPAHRARPAAADWSREKRILSATERRPERLGIVLRKG